MPSTSTATVDRGPALTRLNSVESRLTTALIDVNPSEILDLIRRALDDVGLKHAAAARLAGVKESQFSAALAGRGNFGAAWLWAQDDRFLLRLCELMHEARRLSPANASVVRRRRIVELVELLLTECAQ
jgi:hypothetical protein